MLKNHYAVNVVLKQTFTKHLKSMYCLMHELPWIVYSIVCNSLLITLNDKQALNITTVSC